METTPIKADRLVTINVDVQNDFCPGGALAVTNGDQVITPLNQLNTFTRAHQGLVIATGDQHPATTPHFDTWPVHCVAGTDGAAFHPDLELTSDDIIIDKGTGQTDGYSGFEGQAHDGRTIETFVRPRDNEHVVVAIGGLATDYCVLNTTLDALKVAEDVRRTQRGKLTVFAIKDAMRAVDLHNADGDRALIQMEEAGAIITTSLEILTGKAIELAQ